jgi:NAD(P)H-hydrate epimerase
LAIRGYEFKLIHIESSLEITGDAEANHAILQSIPHSGIEFPPLAKDATSDTIKILIGGVGRGADWVVDAMLGTGSRGEPRPRYHAAIDWMNEQSCKKLAVDVPSGLDCDTGQPSAHTVRADHTCTFAAMKVGFLQPAARAFTGTVHVCDIGVPPGLIDEVARLYST